MRALLALATVLMRFAVVRLTQDWFNALLNELPLTHVGGGRGAASVAEMLVTLVVWPFILLFNLLAIPGVLVAAESKPLRGCGVAIAAPVLMALSVLCGLTSDGLWLRRRS